MPDIRPTKGTNPDDGYAPAGSGSTKSADDVLDLDFLTRDNTAEVISAARRASAADGGALNKHDAASTIAAGSSFDTVEDATRIVDGRSWYEGERSQSPTLTALLPHDVHAYVSHNVDGAAAGGAGEAASWTLGNRDDDGRTFSWEAVLGDRGDLSSVAPSEDQDGWVAAEVKPLAIDTNPLITPPPGLCFSLGFMSAIVVVGVAVVTYAYGFNDGHL